MTENTRGAMYLGGVIDPTTRQRGDRLDYQSSQLTTHGVIVGMTGSGKTGLGIIAIEEALRDDIPCLISDPKGDMGNLLLNFPDFLKGDFREWIDEGQAERQGITPDELAASTAQMWKEGLAGWDIGSARLRELATKVGFSIYTPGSNAGVPLNVLGSLAAPDLDWEMAAETGRDEIEGFVSSLLVLAGISANPISSPEHILLATLIERSWRNGKDPRPGVAHRPGAIPTDQKAGRVRTRQVLRPQRARQAGDETQRAHCFPLVRLLDAGACDRHRSAVVDKGRQAESVDPLPPPPVR